jgi:glyoxylase-like metal-dependent hydrolase (beta-lactamase superfamily II)
MRSTTVMALLLVSLVVGSMLAVGQETEPRVVALGDDLEVRELADGLWQHVCRVTSGGVTFTCNGMVVARGGEVLIADTAWNDDQTARLLDWVTEKVGEVRYLVATHFHPDNMGGIDAVHARGIATYGLELTAELAKKDGHAPPRNTFRDRLDLVLGGEKVGVRFVGAGHTRDNIVVWLPERQVLFGGCLVKSADARSLGFTGDADLEAWPGTLEKLKAEFAEARLIIPGHGEPGGMELVENSLRLLRERPPSH